MSVDLARRYFDRVQFAEFLGVQVIDVEPERAVLRMPYREEHMNPGNVLNGGASASLLNMAGTLAAWTGIDLEAQPYLGCVDLSVQYLNAGRREDVLAEARVLRRGRDLFFLEVALRNQVGQPLCQGLMSYRAPDYTAHAPRLQAQHQLLRPPDDMTPPEDAWLFRGYVHKLGITPQHQKAGCVRLSMPCTTMHLDEYGRIHTGALASLVDIAGVSATWSLVPDRHGCRGSTVGLQISYTATACEPVIADSHVQQRSEELFFSTVHVTTAATGRLVAMGQVSYRLLEPRLTGV